jgi:outer membrane receptor protein involved in Fe transport
VISGATVTIKSVGTGFSQTKSATEEGIATFTSLRPGFYDVTATAKGFADLTKRVELTVGARSEVVMSMSTQSVEEKITVVAGEGGVEVNTQSQELSTVVSSKQITELPSLTRNPYDFVALSGNVSADPGGSTGRGVGFSINGQRASSTSILLDGGENVDYFVSAVGQTVPLDSVQEYRVITNNFTAEYGRASGGIVNLATKSGTNSFHGSAYEFNRISALASNDFGNNANSLPKGVFTRNQFGYSLGGPIIKDKLFFFSSTEWTRVRSTQDLITLVPTPAFIASAAPATQAFFSGFKLRAPINGGVLPGGQFGEVIYTVPTDAGAGSPQNTYYTINRVDLNISSNTQLSGHYALESSVTQLGTINTSPWVGFDTGQTVFNQNYLISLNHTFSPRLVSSSRFTYNRLNLQQPLGSAPAGPTLYLTGASPTRINGLPVALPGYNEFTPGSAIPFGGPQNVIQVQQEISYIRANHQFRFGGQFLYIQDNRAFGAYEEPTEQLGNNLAKGLSNFVAGQLFLFQAAVFPQGKFPGQTLQLPVGPPDFTRSNRYKDFALYAIDTWHVRPRLTLNLGLRYEYYGVQGNVNRNKDSNFYFGSGSNIFERIRNGRALLTKDSPMGALWDTSPLNFAPRIGFAWDVFGDGKTSVRGGYGIGFERNFGNVTFNVIQNPPNYAVVSLLAGADVATIPVTTSNFGPLAGSSGTKVLPNSSLRAVDPNIKTAYAQFYSASVERQLAGRTLLSVEYSGSTGTKLYSIANINRASSGKVYLGSGSTNPFSGAASSRLNGGYSNINFRGSDGSSRYNGMIISLENSGLRGIGLRFTARYTYSASRDDLSSTFSESSNNFNLGYLDPFNPRLDYGYSDFDTRHRFSGSFGWDIPFAKDTKNWRRQVLDGWSLQGIFVAHTGTPFTVFDCTNASAVCTRLVPGAGGTVQFSGSGHLQEDPSPGAFDHPIFINLGKANFQPYANSVSGTADFGPYPSNMTKRNAFRGPGLWNLDSAVLKNFRLTERYSLQFRSEFYNVFNHANLFVNGSELDVSSTQLADGTPFVPASWAGRRFVQFAMKFLF